MRFLRAAADVEYSIKFAWQLLQVWAVSGDMALQSEHVCKADLRGFFSYFTPRRFRLAKDSAQ
jgi:hypothetical protein